MKMISALFLLLFISVALCAQQPQARVKPPVCRGCVRRVAKPAKPSPKTIPPSPNFFVGEARVDVTKDETVVKLAMAQHGSVLIELPANDGPRYIIPGDPEMATVDEKALERNKRAIVVRPGTQFVSPPRNTKTRTPAATVTAQMRSGLVVTFLFYPVDDLAQNVHRCVLSYNRDEVVARRRAVGLPVNLDTETRGEMTAQSAALASISEQENGDNQSEKEVAKGSTTPSAKSGTEAKETHVATNPETTEESEILASLREAIEQAKKKPKQFKHWSKASHGLALSSLVLPLTRDSYRLAILAVKSKAKEPMKLTPNSPDLVIEMVDEQGKPLNIETLKKVRVESSEPTGLIQPKATVYYAIAYVAPLLGAHQRIRVSIAHSNAADEPASIMLATTNK